MSERVGEASPLNVEEEPEIVEAHARATQTLGEEKAKTAALRAQIERTRKELDSAASSALSEVVRAPMSRLRTELELLQAQTAEERQAQLPLIEEARELDAKLVKWEARRKATIERSGRSRFVIATVLGLGLGWILFNGAANVFTRLSQHGRY